MKNLTELTIVQTYDFKGGNAEVVAGDPKVIAEVLKNATEFLIGW